MVVPRAMVLTCNFAPDEYQYSGRFDDEYMGFEYDPENHILNISSPDPDAEVPSWIMERIPVSAVMQIEQAPGRKKTTFIVKIKAEAVQ